ncbi:MAG: histidinol dehydrogenase [Candidatus Melainabacteria bacterium]|nr:histidinol dehydrogenase [Candidatus Melainabacteria bacterium]
MIPILCGDDALNFTPIRDEENESVIEERVKEIVGSVRRDKDAALTKWATKLNDKVTKNWLLDADSIDAACKRLPQESKDVIDIAAKRIKEYATAVMSIIKPVTVDNGTFQTGMDFKPVSRVACYVPSGRYPLPSTALMTAMTARVSGVKEICILTPSVCDEIIYAARVCDVSEIYQLGGAQAASAVAFGTESVKRADMLVGPGNAYLTEAKRQLQGQIGIDMLAGPSEIAIIADSGANPEWLALDLLSQAEHDPGARAYLFSDSKEIAEATAKEISKSLDKLDLPEFVRQSIKYNAIVVLPSLANCVDKVNELAPEHLQLQVKDPENLKPGLLNYGALFMGYYASVPHGDYMAGPNHTLPTGGAARYSGALNPLVFLRAQSWMKSSDKACHLGKETAQFARLEGLTAHAAAALCRVGD